MMRRVIVALIVLVMVTALAGIASAAPGGGHGKPPASTTSTTTPTLDPCTFTNGVLDGWDGTTDELFVCEWTVTDRPQTFTFHIEGNYWDPYLGVKDAFTPAGDFCEPSPQHMRGYYTESILQDITLPEDGQCGDRWDDYDDDAFALMVKVGKAKGKAVSFARLCIGPCPSS